MVSAAEWLSTEEGHEWQDQLGLAVRTETRMAMKELGTAGAFFQLKSMGYGGPAMVVEPDWEGMVFQAGFDGVCTIPMKGAHP